jgi:transposase
VITAAQVIGKIDAVARVAIDARLARLAGCAAVPVSSGRTDCYRLDRRRQRQLNHAIPHTRLSRIRHDPRSAPYMAKQRTAARRSATRPAASNATSPAGILNLLRNREQAPITLCST